LKSLLFCWRKSRPWFTR